MFTPIAPIDLSGFALVAAIGILAGVVLGFLICLFLKGT